MKLIDWTKVPRGTMTNEGELMHVYEPMARAFVYDGVAVVGFNFGDLRIAPQTRWTYHDGGECPVPDGLTVEVMGRNGDPLRRPYCLLDGLTVEVMGRNGELLRGRATGHYRWEYTDSGDDYYSDVIAYRITGVDRAGGWTDDPSEVTE